MKKVMLTTIAIIVWSIPVILLVAMLVPNVSEVKTVDLAAIKSGQIIIGANNWLKPDFNCLTSEFVGISYELVMVGVADDGKIIYLGKTTEEWYDDKGKPTEMWYQAEENLDLGFLQEVKEAKIDGQNLVVNYGKNGAQVGLLSFISILLFGLIGFVVFLYR